MSETPDGAGGLLGAAERRFGRFGRAGYTLVLSAVTLGAVGALGLATNQPYVFPSLGPTVLLFFESPLRRSASALCTVVGHAVAMAAGVGALWAYGLTDTPSVLTQGLTVPRVAAAATAVGLTALVLLAVRCPHPPAGATTLLICLGMLTTGADLLTIGIGVLLVTVVGLALNRLLGVPQAVVPPRDRR
ncbi:HPP family protein [Saccharomonospora iraqiensis]|uniref:HPP family protein n=1 Tax=Saccharomonospora iraqiensis TaxID=52698 RepID=UPI0003FBDB3B|nr:HPP family protein [Saccharomonospora iraqiensis]